MLFEDIMSIMNIDGDYNSIQSNLNNSNNNIDVNKIIKSMNNIVKDIRTNKLNND